MSCLSLLSNITHHKKQEINVFYDNFIFNPINWQISQEELSEDSVYKCIIKMPKIRIELILSSFELGYFSEYIYAINIDLKNSLSKFKKLTRKKRKKEQTKLAKLYGGFRLINKVKTYPLFNFMKNPYQFFTVNNQKVKIISFERFLYQSKNPEYKIIGEFSIR